MIKFKNSMVVLYISALAISQLVSCSKDSDLLSEYVINEEKELSSLNFLVDDFFTTQFNSTQILDVLANDDIGATEGVTITSVSEPSYGQIEILENSTLKFISISDNESSGTTESVTDTIVYTTGTTDINSPIETDSATVVITISNEEQEYDLLSVDVLAAKADYALYQRILPSSKRDNYNDSYLGEYGRILRICENGDQGDIYHLDALQGMVALFEATGNKKYLNDVIRAYTTLFKAAKPSRELSQNGAGYNDEYLSWYGNPETNLTRTGILGQQQLSESRSFMHLSRLLYILYNSPNLRTETNVLSAKKYQEHFDYFLSFLEVNFWEKWLIRNPYAYQYSGLDSVSSWGYIGWNLWICTNNNKYKDIYDKINHDIGIPGIEGGVKQHFEPNTILPEAYQWNTRFNNEPFDGRAITDHAHAARTVKFVVEDFTISENTYKSENIVALIKTIDVFWPPSFEGSKRIHYWLDGKDKSGNEERNFMPEGWMCLGRFNLNLQERFERIDTSYFIENKTEGVFWGELAYNKAFIDKAIKFPKNLNYNSL